MIGLLLRHLPSILWAWLEFRDYEPAPVTVARILRWLRQFDRGDRPLVTELLRKVRYIDKKAVRDFLVQTNRALLARLDGSGLPATSVIYIQMHDPGSSSGVMLNMLRDGARIERLGCYFIDWRDVRRLHEITSLQGRGAIIYVDDASGTGHQFCEVRDFLADHIVGSYAEFFLVVSICEEAISEVGKRAVEPVSAFVHAKADRPLHPNSTLFQPTMKKRLIAVAEGIDKAGALGYRGLASMQVIYRNAPNTVPVILRGNVGQQFAGILPRTTDLPPLSDRAVGRKAVVASIWGAVVRAWETFSRLASSLPGPLSFFLLGVIYLLLAAGAAGPPILYSLGLLVHSAIIPWSLLLAWARASEWTYRVFLAPAIVAVGFGAQIATAAARWKEKPPEAKATSSFISSNRALLFRLAILALFAAIGASNFVLSSMEEPPTWSSPTAVPQGETPQATDRAAPYPYPKAIPAMQDKPTLGVTPEATRAPAIPVGEGTPVPVPPGPVSLQDLCEVARPQWEPSEWAETGGEADAFGTTVAFSPLRDEPVLAMGSRGGMVALYRFDTGHVSSPEYASPAHAGRVTGLAFNYSGTFLVSASSDRSVSSWIHDNGVIRRRDGSVSLAAHPLSISYSYPYIALGLDSGAIKIIEAGTLDDRYYLPNAHLAHIWSIAFSPDGNFLISGGADDAAYVWRIDGGEIVGNAAMAAITPSHGRGVVSAVAASALGERPIFAAATDNGYLSLHLMVDTTNPAPVDASEEWPAESGIWALGFSSDGEYIAVGTDAGEVLLLRTQELLEYDTDSVDSRPRVVRIQVSTDFGASDPTPRITSVAFSPDDTYLAIGFSRGGSIWSLCPQ